MESVQYRNGNFRKTIAISGGTSHHRRLEDVRERATTDAAIILVVAMIIALYAAMFVGVYRWIHYDPVLPLDNQPQSAELNLLQSQ
jgi:hypothetical protein